ncbi:PaaX family transcriptional regulator [Microbacterium sp. A93]|uniref:PaaX family transcriptional regulator n=1 Tax=Microbacterium sp. A93 TaxID=3450716 RepID=UPI003F423638
MAAHPTAVDIDANGPRWQVGNNPQHLLVTIVGDYWIGSREYFPTAALIRLVGELGVSADSGRVSLGRLARRNILQAQKTGRRTAYRFADAIIPGAYMVGRAIASYGSDAEWSGKWTLCAFSLPDSRKETRRQLRSRLRMLGFAPVYDGLWASPLSRANSARALLDELDVDSGSVFTAIENPREGRPALSIGQDLDDLRKQLDAFGTRWQSATVDMPDLTPAESFIVRTSMTDDYRRLISLDPNLPDSTLPEGWADSRAQARKLFHSIYLGTATQATSHVASAIAEHAPDLAPLVHTHLPEDFLHVAAGTVDCAFCTAVDV